VNDRSETTQLAVLVKLHLRVEREVRVSCGCGCGFVGGCTGLQRERERETNREIARSGDGRDVR